MGSISIVFDRLESLEEKKNINYNLICIEKYETEFQTNCICAWFLSKFGGVFLELNELIENKEVF